MTNLTQINWQRGACCVALSAWLAGCAAHQPPPPPEPALFDWQGDSLEGPVALTINTTTQRATITVSGQYAGWTTVATGKDGHDTPAGNYKITEKIVDKYSSHYGRLLDASGEVFQADADARKDIPPPGGRFDHAPMPYWMRLTNWGIGMHAGYIPEPGSRASKGCIRLPKAFAPIIFDRVVVGTPVRIVN